METNRTRTCRACSDVIRGRSDKRFCDDLCRNKYHNQTRKRPALSDDARFIQRVLTRNHRSLCTLLRGRSKCLVHRDALIRIGFVFGVHSHRQLDRSGVESIYCLDYGYRFLDDNRVLVFKYKGGIGIFQY